MVDSVYIEGYGFDDGDYEDHDFRDLINSPFKTSKNIDNIKYSNKTFNKKKSTTPICISIPSACKECGCEIVIRKNKKTNNEFYGCSGFPHCKWSQNK